MYVALDHQQAEVLRELLESAAKELRFEIARSDIHEYRAMLVRREEIVEQLLSKLSDEAPTVGL